MKHFHCCYCPKLYINRSDFIKHLTKCQQDNEPRPETPPPAPIQPETTPSAPVELQTTPSAPVQLQTTPSAPVQLQTPPVQQKQVHGQKIRKVQCPHCTLWLSKQNLKRHIIRNHITVSRDITAESHLQSECINPDKGVYAVAKSFRGPCIPIHVQKKTWGTSHQLTCEVDLCSSQADFQRRSGLRPKGFCGYGKKGVFYGFY
ncbi:hypothetical protein AAFF_G00316260, partial [Aldrovandia affinis]